MDDTNAQKLMLIIKGAGWSPTRAADLLGLAHVQQLYTYKAQAESDDGKDVGDKRCSQPSNTMVKLATLLAAIEKVY